MIAEQKLREKVWPILHEECGAETKPPPDFINWPDCVEYRFMGALGFGGKVWYNRALRPDPAYVTCYREDETEERKAMIENANKRLAGLWRGEEHGAAS